VRVVEVPGFSRELCGGTHCGRTGEIGLVKVTAERGIASGTRRIEAVTGEGSLGRFREDYEIVHALEEQLCVPRDQVLAEIRRRFDQVRELQRAVDKQKLGAVRVRLVRAAEEAAAAGERVLAERVDGLEAQELRELADELRAKLRSGVVVLGRAGQDKASLLVAVTDDLKGTIPAGDLVRTLGKRIGGGGGGRPDLAEAGGKDPSRLDEALREAVAIVNERLGGVSKA